MKYKISNGMVWDTEEAAFISGEKAGEDRTTELRDYAGNAATVDFLKEVLLQQPVSYTHLTLPTTPYV